MPTILRFLLAACTLAPVVCWYHGTTLTSAAVETVLVNVDGRPRQLTGEVVVEDSVGSLLLKTNDGAMWPLQASKIQSRKSDSQELERLNKDELTKRLLEELGPEFQSHHSKNYVVVYNTTRVYAKWCSSLLERLQRGFLAYWKKQGCDVHEPKDPLIVLVFGNKASYAQHAKAELGAAVNSAIGYYSMQSNRIVMYDLTGVQSLRRLASKRGTLHDITRLLSHPEAEPLVATIVHEATHQIAYNCGLQKRYGSNPVWLAEGMAMYFETPDLDSNRSWGGIGKINYPRWNRFRKNVNSGNGGTVATLKSMIADDQRFRNPLTAIDAYAEAWAWTYYLLTWRPEEYVAYLEMLAEKPLLVPTDEETRIAEFRKHFGDLQSLHADFYRQMSRLD